jgi:hypothetical protein
MIDWSDEKNELLKSTRGISFEEVAIELDAEEQEYEDAFDEFVPAPESERVALIAAAKTGRRPLSVRIDSSDIAALKRLAASSASPCECTTWIPPRSTASSTFLLVPARACSETESWTKATIRDAVQPDAECAG